MVSPSLKKVKVVWSGVKVSRLKRGRYGPAMLPERVRSHSFYESPQDELAILMVFAGMKPEQH